MSSPSDGAVRIRPSSVPDGLITVEDHLERILRALGPLEAYDQPPAAHRGLVDDARKRLATLERTDAPASAVAPR